MRLLVVEGTSIDSRNEFVLEEFDVGTGWNVEL
jgi:hypothetical protein